MDLRMIDRTAHSSFSPSSGPSFSRVHVIARLIAALGGGWLFVWGFIALGIMALLAAGMPFRDARSLLHLLAFLLFLFLCCWAFAARSLVRVYAVLVGGGVAMTCAAWWMARASI